MTVPEEIAFENTIAFPVVPATAGHVIVAVPDVDPDPVMTHDVVPVMPHVIAVPKRFDHRAVELPREIELSVLGEMALEKITGFVVVPAIAGHVIVAVPEVDPEPVMTHDVVPVTPHARDVNVPAAGAVPPIAGGDAKEF